MDSSVNAAKLEKHLKSHQHSTEAVNNSPEVPSPNHAITEAMTAVELYNTWAIGGVQEEEAAEIQRQFDEQSIQALKHDHPAKIFELEDVIPMVKEGVQVLVKDDFTRCFMSQRPNRWNWNIYLWPLWLLGLLVRYCFLLPLRFLTVIVGVFLFAVMFTFVTTFTTGTQRTIWERWCLQFLSKVFVISWSGVIRYHGVRPKRGPNQIFVANHTSMIDVVILMQHMPYAAVGQQHKGLVAFFQNRIFGCLGCLWFERNEASDRERVARKIKEHILDENNNPLLIFPEGTCVNNKYCVMFKKGAFELGAKVYPIAMKYNKEFCDPFWNSMKESFWFHVFKLMTCWAVVCDVYYLPPQTIRPDEQPTDFARRVKEMIAKKAKLISVPWDGYLKRLRPSSRFIKYRQNMFAASMRRRLTAISTVTSPLSSPPTSPRSSENDLRHRNVQSHDNEQNVDGQ